MSRLTAILATVAGWTLTILIIATLCLTGIK